MQMFFQKILSFLMCVFTLVPFLISFSNKKIDRDFSISEGSFSETNICLNSKNEEISVLGGVFENGAYKFSENFSISFDDGKCDFFNYYAITYSSDAYLKCNIKYIQGMKEKNEDFFLQPSENKTEFYSFTDDYLSKKKASRIISISFIPLNKESAEIKIYGIATFNRQVEESVVYAENEHLKIGINLTWGGALSYLEDLDSNVETVKKDGKIYVDSNASKRYSEKAVNKNVNLINCFDAGRLVQQSYYGTFDSGYEGGDFMGEKWNYNPVQGGNKYNEESKIVDLKIEENSLYIKCRPLDWSKEKEYITPSYMEATYVLHEKNLHVSCSFTDFSGYPKTYTTQEMPAFYCIEPLDCFYYLQNGELKCKDDLIFWPDAGYPNFTSDEGWVAFTGKFSDSFGIGLYTPGYTNFLAGIYDHGKTTNSDPCYDVATSYVAMVRHMTFESFSPIEYSYSLTTGTVDEIRNTFLNN